MTQHKSMPALKISPIAGTRFSMFLTKSALKFGLEVHPTEIAFDIVTAERAIEAVNGREAFGFNYDPSHLGYQGGWLCSIPWTIESSNLSRPHEGCLVGRYTPLIPVYSVDIWTSATLGEIGISVPSVVVMLNFEEIIRALNHMEYDGPLSIEWEDSGMDREHGARESCAAVKGYDFEPSAVAFDAAFEE